MEGIHDALDKAIQIAENERNVSDPQEHFRDEIFTEATIKQRINPDLLRQKRIVTYQNQDAEADAFRMLRTKIFKDLKKNNWRSFGITAPTQGAGKTTLAVNLAITMAMDVNQSVLLVDLDLRYPKVHWYFGLENQNGLRDYFISEKPLSEILINPGIDRLTILPGRGQALGSSEILSGPKMKQLVNEINFQSQSRIVIYDLPPVLATDDVLATSDYYDAVLIVVEEGKSQPEEVSKTLKLLSGKNILGTVLNKSRNPPEHLTY